MRNLLCKLRHLRNNLVVEVKVINGWGKEDVLNALGVINDLIAEVSVLCNDVDYCITDNLGAGRDFSKEYSRRIGEFTSKNYSGSIEDRLLNLSQMVDFMVLQYEEFVCMMEGAGLDGGRFVNLLHERVYACLKALEYLIIEYN